MEASKEGVCYDGCRRSKRRPAFSLETSSRRLSKPQRDRVCPGNERSVLPVPRAPRALLASPSAGCPGRASPSTPSVPRCFFVGAFPLETAPTVSSSPALLLLALPQLRAQTGLGIGGSCWETFPMLNTEQTSPWTSSSLKAGLPPASPGYFLWVGVHLTNLFLLRFSAQFLEQNGYLRVFCREALCER